MRVVVVADHLGRRAGIDAGVPVARAWRQRGAEVAVVPVGVAGDGFLTSYMALTGARAQVARDGIDLHDSLVIGESVVVVDLSGADLSSTSASIGSVIAELADAYPFVDEMVFALGPTPLSPDLLFSSLTDLVVWGRSRMGGGTVDRRSYPLSLGDGKHFTVDDLHAVVTGLGGKRLRLVVHSDDVAARLGGITGVIGQWAFDAGWDVERRLHASRAIERLDQLCASLTRRPTLAAAPGSGAGGGLGFLFMQLEALARAAGDVADNANDLPTAPESTPVVHSGPGYLASVSGLDDTIASADCVVGVVTVVDVDHDGGEVIADLAARCAREAKPLVVISACGQVSVRDARERGVEVCYSLTSRIQPGPGAPMMDHLVVDGLSDDEITDLVVPIAQSWSW